MSRVHPIGKRPAVLAPVTLSVLALAIAACGAQPDAESDGAASGPADASQEYAPGVPTLEALYAGTEAEPPAEGPPIAAGRSLVFVSCGQASPGCAGVANAMQEPAELLGWDYRIIDGQLNANNGWANGIRQAIAAEPDAIVVHGMNCPDVQQPLQEAADAGISVMGLENVDCDDELLPDGGGEPLFTVPMQYSADMLTGGDYFERWGAVQADYAINATQGRAKVIQLVYQPIFGAHQKEGQDAELAKCEDCEVVATIEFGPADQVPNGALVQRFRTVLSQHPEANAVLANFDSVVTTAGVGQAVVEAGRTDMVVVGGEGYASAQQLLPDSNGLTAQAAHDGTWMSWGAVDNLNRFFNGEPAVPQGVGFRIIDAEHNLSPAGEDYATPVDYRTAYRTLWGVGS